MNDAEKYTTISRWNNYYEVAYTFLGLGKFDAAIQAIQALKALEPKYSEALKP